jgi:hypothetical protein
MNGRTEKWNVWTMNNIISIRPTGFEIIKTYGEGGKRNCQIIYIKPTFPNFLLEKVELLL